MSRRQGIRTAFVAACVATVLVGCENLEPTPAERAAVEQAAREYLGALAEAYSSLDPRPLQAYATGSEIAAVSTLLRKLAGSGDRLEASLLQVDVDSIRVFREVNATVRLVEVWDVRRVDAYNGQEKGHNPRSVQSSIVQMRLIEGRWRVTARQVQGVEGPHRWRVETPRPQATEDAG